MTNYGKTTCFAAISSDAISLNGDEVFEIYGPQFHEVMEGFLAGIAMKVHNGQTEIVRRMKGLKRNWSCLEKALLVRHFIGAGDVMIGSLLVWNNERNGTFGYYYNPPYEFHAWVELRPHKFVIDFALPGVVESGLNLKDQYGYILTDIKPVALCGWVPDWLVYESFEKVSKDDYSTLAAKFALDLTSK